MVWAGSRGNWPLLQSSPGCRVLPLLLSLLCACCWSSRRTFAMDGLTGFLARDVSYSDLPPQIAQLVSNSPDAYAAKLLEYSFQHRRPYGSLGSLLAFPNPTHPQSRISYFKALVEFLRSSLRVFPYEHASVVIQEIGLTPFEYYRQMLVDIMKAEQAYDVLPNFTAIDALRWIAVGRNEYIDAMNQCRSKKIWWKLNKANTAREVLPKAPVVPSVVASVKPYFSRYLVLHNLHRVAQNQGVKSDQWATSVADYRLEELVAADGVYFLVEISPDDSFIIPPMSGFVMNRSINYSDPLEKLLYDVLVSMDERSSAQHVAEILNVPFPLVQNALSLLCQLGFILKNQDSSRPSQQQQQPQRPQQQLDIFGDDASSSSSLSSALSLASGAASFALRNAPAATAGAISATDDLLFGSSVSENGSISSSLSSAASPTGRSLAVAAPASATATGTLSHPSGTAPPTSAPLSSAAGYRVAFLFCAELAAELMAGSVSSGMKELAVTLYEAGKLTHEKLEPLLGILDASQASGLMFEGEAAKYALHASILARTLRFLCALPGVKLDMLRTESISGLEHGTMMRILNQYHALIPVAPLSNPLPHQILHRQLPQYFGAPFSLWTTPWSTLFLWGHLLARHPGQNGSAVPPFVVVPHGSVLRTLPEFLLVDSPWTETMERVTMFPFLPNAEPTSVPRCSALHWINDALSRSALLIFPSPSLQFAGSGHLAQELASVFPPRAGWEPEEPFSMDCSFGYVEFISFTGTGLLPLSPVSTELRPVPATLSDATLAAVPFLVHFGIPLSDETLNAAVCSDLARFEVLVDPQAIVRHQVQMEALVQKFSAFLVDPAVDGAAGLVRRTLHPTDIAVAVERSSLLDRNKPVAEPAAEERSSSQQSVDDLLFATDADVGGETGSIDVLSAPMSATGTAAAAVSAEPATARSAFEDESCTPAGDRAPENARSGPEPGGSSGAGTLLDDLLFS